MRGLAMFATGCCLAAHALVAQAQVRVTLIETAKAFGPATADYNGDGHDDIFIVGHDLYDRIWYWTPEGYVPSAQILDRKWVDRHDCDAADVNLDGRMDFYCSMGAEKGTGAKTNELWLQDADGVFSQAAGHGADNTYGRSRHPVFFDLNHDGLPDLYDTVYDELRDDGQPNINRVYVNQGGGRFSEVTTRATGRNGFQCGAKGDVNGDGWDDLVVCKAHFVGHLYLNNRRSDFDDLAEGRFGAEWVDAKLADVTGDGRDDLLLITAGDVFQVWPNTGSMPFFTAPEFEQTLPHPGASLAVGDFNRDGRSDVYVVLADSACDVSGHDLAPDVVYSRRGAGRWNRWDPSQRYDGCGHLADVLDGKKVLLMNGAGGWFGPNYLLEWRR